LAAQGYDLVGGRLLPGDQGARAQFMYQNGRGERVTLYVGAIDAGKAGAAMPAGETAFRFTSEAGASSFYWVDQGFGYALAGRLERADLLRLSEAVYRQL
jgi:anti-sigma factor RsiW